MKRAKFKNVLCIFIAVVLLTACNPFKVTDPNDARFDISQFEFNDYHSSEELMQVIRKYAAQGTSRSAVEVIFIEHGNASILDRSRDIPVELGYVTPKIIKSQQNSRSLIRYDHEGLNSTFYWQIYVFYDAQHRVVQIVSGNEIAFPEGD